MTDTNWRERVACRGVEFVVFFPDRDGDLSEARRLCQSCPVVAACLDDALAVRDVDGFRGGKTGDERHALLIAQRRRARTPKPADVDTVPVLGVIRRRRALACMGYSLADLAPRLGIAESTAGSHMWRQRVLKATHDRWRQVYDELSSTPGGNLRAKASAVNLGWAPPWAWDDTTIDDPAAQPLLEAAA